MAAPTLRRTALACALAAAAVCANAHDTWFAPRPGASGEVALLLGTGNRFPVHESGIDARYIVRGGCRHDGTGAPVRLQRVQDLPTSLALRAAARVDEPLTCWAQLRPFDVELTDQLVQVYLDEIQAPVAVREAWSRMQQRGVRWKERFTKNARIALQPHSVGTAKPVNMSMDVLLESTERPLQPGQTLRFQVQRDQQPLPDFSVELVNERNPKEGTWAKTDAQGRVSFAVPSTGRWVLRGTDLRLSTSEADLWESRFITLAFEVGASATP